MSEPIPHVPPDAAPPAATPPLAPQRPYSYTCHGVNIDDPWRWLRDPNYPTVEDEEILAYLNAENDYFNAMMEPYKGLTDTIFEEIKGRQQPDLASVPWKDGDWYYQWKFAEESQYRVWLRWPASDADARLGPTAQAETILDEPALAEGLEYFRLGSLGLNHGANLMAYGADTDGSERFRLVVKNLETGELLPEEIPDTTGGVVWSADDSSFFYTLVDDNWRPWQVRRHVLGRPVDQDAVIYEESDPGFFVGIGESSSREYVIIGAGDHVTSEVRIIPSADPGADALVVAPRRPNHEYSVDHQGDRFVIRTNDTHKNTRLAVAPADDPTEAAWTPLVDASDTHYIRGFEAFQDFLAVEERIGGLDHIRLIDRAGETTYIEFPENAYTTGVGQNREFQTDTLRLDYTSMVTPNTVFDYHLGSGELEVRQVQEVPSGYDSSEYVTERLLARARDGAEVPVSLVRRRETPVDGSAPVYLYGYGAYGHAIPPSFSTTRLSLLDRGFIFAIAHIRGGDDMGYHWYEAGKLDRRTNTFNDFVDVARHLVKEGYGSEGRIAIAGGSAGGQLMGAVVNQAPELWGAVAAHVPFVDVLNTMLDDSLPLTPIEWPEWGNPIEDEGAFEYIRSYSPYDQLAARDYPPILATAGLNDPRVTYWEPAKYVARLRVLKTDDNLALLKTNMGAGHGGRSGRYDRLYEVAEEYAFILAVMGLVEQKV
ncbi:MAG: S9 family peptidase [Chloroflexota bacterium]|nr:S9 family peptidase [Chloroflexota bacterium]